MKNTREQLFVELIKLLQGSRRGSIVHEEHKVERGESYTKRRYETMTLDKNRNTAVKIEVHTWGRNP